ncbi:MAG: transcriptional regulator [Candidatus Acididesulfobacter diazotrophicus]|uniref:Transcriptional regulator n=1 Tax=Candidatus Acididesulfobacter diazotrophicus TaxID=2597226 RepID=A0A519BQG2_9DELT|nr:MAG: transcriptional regulator [Candidatus Acididesulfobacter diazotrophicus]
MIFSNSKEFGELIRKARKVQGMNQSELAGASGTGVRFIVDLEKGKPTVEFEKAILVAAMLGIKLDAKIPDNLEG